MEGSGPEQSPKTFPSPKDRKAFGGLCELQKGGNGYF